MAEEGLKRSVTSFRRQGSSGMVWDDKFLAGLWNQNQKEEAKPSGSENQQEENTKREERIGSSSVSTLERSRTVGSTPYRTVNVAPSLTRDPPSPKVAAIAPCGLFCGFFGKPVASKYTLKSNPPKSKKRR